MASSRSSGGWPPEMMAPRRGRPGTACSTAPRAVTTDLGVGVGRLWLPLTTSRPTPTRNSNRVSPTTMRAGLVLGPGSRRRGSRPRPPAPGACPLRPASTVVAPPPAPGSRAPGVIGAGHGSAATAANAPGVHGRDDRRRGGEVSVQGPVGPSSARPPRSVRSTTSGRPAAQAPTPQSETTSTNRVDGLWRRAYSVPRHRGPQGPRGGVPATFSPLALCHRG